MRCPCLSYSFYVLSVFLFVTISYGECSFVIPLQFHQSMSSSTRVLVPLFQLRITINGSFLGYFVQMASFRYKHNTLVVTYSQKKNLMVVQKARTKRNHDAPSILFFGESFTRRSPNFSSNELTKVEIHLRFCFLRLAASISSFP